MLLSHELSRWARELFGPECAEAGQDPALITVVPAGNPAFGDFQCNDALGLAKRLRRAPRELAQSVLSRSALPACLSRCEVAGPGFINMHLDDAWLAQTVVAAAGDERLGVPPIGSGRTVVMDYGGPNITKPLHIGHLRSPNIGSTLDRLYRYLGYRVISDSHLGDWGTQFGITIMGYRHFGDAEAMAQRPMEELERVYVASYERGKSDPEWMNQCRRELVKLQQGDAENRRLWKQFVEMTLRELDRIYARLGITYDLVRGESYYNDALPGLVDDLLARGIAQISEGAVVVFLEEEKLPVCMVRKSDGGFNYATTDIATILSRVAEFRPERIVYIHDERQQTHFQQVFSVCRRLGVTTELQHVWFGLMRLPEGTFSTREGNVIRLERLLEEAETRALAIVQASRPEMPPDQQRRVARSVGTGAVKYADLSQNPQSLVTFTWEKALALDGNSGPYLQYACARIASVRDKYAERFPGLDPERYPVVLTQPVERRLALLLALFPDTVARAAHAHKPNVLCDYLYDVAQTYSTFYQNVPFLRSEEGVRESRVRLSGIVARVLRKGLELLGIEALDRI